MYKQSRWEIKTLDKLNWLELLTIFSYKRFKSPEKATHQWGLLYQTISLQNLMVCFGNIIKTMCVKWFILVSVKKICKTTNTCRLFVACWVHTKKAVSQAPKLKKMQLACVCSCLIDEKINFSERMYLGALCVHEHTNSRNVLLWWIIASVLWSSVNKEINESW